MKRRIEWKAFSGAMALLAHDGARKWAPLLDLIEPIDRLVGQLVRRETSFASDRPQDYVASILAVRAFRLTISQIHLALAGYPDACPNLDRTVWEISVRLLDIASHPVAGALGYLLQGIVEELAAARAEHEHRVAEGMPITNLPANIAMIEKHYGRLQELARNRGLDPQRLQRTHGRLNYRAVCQAFGIEKAYLVNYAFTSGYVHEKNWATHEFMYDAEGERHFEMGPVVASRPEAIADAITNLLLVIGGAASVVGAKSVGDEADAILNGIDRRMKLALSK